MEEARKAVYAEERNAQIEAERLARTSYTKATAQSIRDYKERRRNSSRQLNPVAPGNGKIPNKKQAHP